MSAHSGCDVLVVGGGIAGLTAANRAAQQGLKVVLIERGMDEAYLCNSRYSGGIFHVAFRNVKDRPEALLEAIDAATGGKADPALASALATTCGRSVDWLRDEGAKFMRVGDIAWRQWVLAPPRRLVAGLDWKGRGPDAALRLLAHNLAARGGRLLRGTEATALLDRQGACTGVAAKNAQGTLHFDARVVILADGGFQGNAELVRRHISSAPHKLKQRGAATGVGDGLRMAQAMGAQITDLGYFYGHTLSRDAFTNERVWPYPQIDELCSAGIVVNAGGLRFADEGQGGVSMANAIAKLPDPLAAWALFDEAMWAGPGCAGVIPANPHLIKAGGTLFKANTLQELAAQTHLAAEPLALTVAAYERALSAGQLGKLDPPRTPSARVAMPFRQPPFYAVPLCAGLTYTFGGIAIDEHGRCVRADGSPVRGLYAVGTTAGGIEGVRGCGYVGGLVNGLSFGLRAAEHAAQSLKGAGC